MGLGKLLQHAQDVRQEDLAALGVEVEATAIQGIRVIRTTKKRGKKSKRSRR